MKRVLIALATLASIQMAHAVVEPGHWWVATSPQHAGQLQLVIDQTPEGDFTASVLSLSGRTLRAETLTLDGGADFFIVNKGQLLTQSVLLSDAVTLLAGPSAPQAQGPGVTVGDEFWLGARIRETSSGSGPWTGLGWAHARFDAAGKLTLLDSAVAFRETSLVVGVVPEPATWALMGLGLAGTGLAVRRQRKR